MGASSLPSASRTEHRFKLVFWTRDFNGMVQRTCNRGALYWRLHVGDYSERRKQSELDITTTSEPMTQAQDVTSNRIRLDLAAG